MPWHDQRMYRELLSEELEQEAVERGEDITTVDASGDIGAYGFAVTQVSSDNSTSA